MTLNRFPRALVVKYIVQVLNLSEATYRYHVRKKHVPAARHRLADTVSGPASYYTTEEAQEVIDFFAQRQLWDKAVPMADMCVREMPGRRVVDSVGPVSHIPDSVVAEVIHWKAPIDR